MPDHRAQVIVQLLEQLHELTDPVRAGNGDGQTGLLLMPHAKECTIHSKAWPPRCTCHLRSLNELERLLRLMREDRHTSLLTLASGERVSLRRCWWHVSERYLRCGTATREIVWRSGRWHVPSNVAVVAQPGGWQMAFATEAAAKRRRGTQIRVRVVTWDAQVRQPLVDRGVAWLAESWALDVEPMLPRELMVA